MKKTIIFIFTLLMIINNLFAKNPGLNFIAKTPREKEWFSKNPTSLPIWITEEEKQRKDEIGKYFYPTDPPSAPVRNIAEFEPMEAVLVRYPLGIPVSLVADMSEDIVVTTVVSSYYHSQAISTYQSNGVNMDNCNFLIAPTDSYWIRDYGPWFVINGDNEFGIVNFPYNRPRPNDDDIPIEVADFLNIELYGMDVEHTGGNYMTDGMGISVSTNLVWEENSGLTHTEIDSFMNAYLGIETYYVTEDPLGEYIKHVDCWGKFLAVDKILIGEVPPSDPRYSDFEAIAVYFENEMSSYGHKYEVYRVYTPGNYPYTPYTNSLILNDKVFVPITGSQWDDDAIDTYENAMPGYEIQGISSGSYTWYNTDALHCRTKGIADRSMLYIEHIPLPDTLEMGIPHSIQAKIIPYSGESLITDSLLLYWKTIIDDEYNAVQMENFIGDIYFTQIPAQYEETTIEYYIHAADNSGRSENHPYIGAPDPHTFYVKDFTSIDNPDNILSDFSLHQNFPNPFSIKTKIPFNIPHNCKEKICLEIYNLQGKRIKSYTINNMVNSHGVVEWDGKDFDNRVVSAGIYFYKLTAGTYSCIKQMILIR